MFTGLVQAVGSVVALDGRRLSIQIPSGVWEDPIQIGESIAVDGCCVTVVALGSELQFDLSEETLARTAFGGLEAGSRVNLERALRVGDRLGGHFVQGHVDGVGTVLSRSPPDGSETFRFRVPADGAKFLIDKGSITVNGVSLTVIAPSGSAFDVAVIPHTLGETTLGDLAVGSPVNIEYDVLAKHVAALLGSK